MRTAVKSLLLLVLALLIASPLSAAPKDKKKRGPKKPPEVVRVPKGIELTDAQKEEVAKLNAEYGPKMVELRKKMGLTPEQTKARNEAMKKARAEGKTGKELRAAVEAAVELTDEQKETIAEVEKEVRQLQQEIRQAFMNILTDEQKALMPKQGKGKGKGRKKREG